MLIQRTFENTFPFKAYPFENGLVSQNPEVLRLPYHSDPATAMKFFVVFFLQ